MNTYSPPKEEDKKSFFGHVSEYKFDFSVDDSAIIKHVPYFIFLTILGVLYIANNYYSDRLTRDIGVLEKTVEELRVDHGSYKYEYIHASKYVEIANQVKTIGLIENDKPVIKITPEN
ncbi:FtsL-like putative cell division protein [Flammeovirgaceae bacterium SG7u.111]|nr:FtsL-like putative cell division protein [Flammeovirgaceae bacterium SG7u.132]WPO33804.1 FtsL-like putative cell division protein [Flammeovirgaceae bacterium SG7u.111]